MSYQSSNCFQNLPLYLFYYFFYWVLEKLQIWRYKALTPTAGKLIKLMPVNRSWFMRLRTALRHRYLLLTYYRLVQPKRSQYKHSRLKWIDFIKSIHSILFDDIKEEGKSLQLHLYFLYSFVLFSTWRHHEHTFACILQPQ